MEEFMLTDKLRIYLQILFNTFRRCSMKKLWYCA